MISESKANYLVKDKVAASYFTESRMSLPSRPEILRKISALLGRNLPILRRTTSHFNTTLSLAPSRSLAR